jgi:hydroxyethylthiazole kinase-like sugar kinase family protein
LHHLARTYTIISRTRLSSAPAVFPCRLAGEEGLKAAPIKGPGSLRVGLLDNLHLMDQATVEAGVKLQKME